MENKMVRQPQVEKQEKGGMLKQLFKIERGKPPLRLIVILITIVIILTSWGIFKIIGSEHDIRVVIDCDEFWSGSISVYDETHYVNDFGEREYTYTMREGQALFVSIHRMGGGNEPLTVTVYDNGVLVIRETSTSLDGNVNFEYTVGE